MNTALQTLLDQWRLWPLSQPPELQKTFTSGLNHTTALLGTADGELVIKKFAVPNNGNEVAAQRWAARLGLAPRIIFHSAEHAYCVMEFIPDHNLEAQLRPDCCKQIRTTQLASMAEALNTLHSVDITADAAAIELKQQLGHFNILHWCNVYLPKAGQTANSIHQKLQPILESYLADQTGECLCHNDLVAANCFAADDRAHFIDWEFAQVHNPWFDIAALIYYLNLDKQQCQQLMQHYNPAWLDKLKSDIFFSSQCALLWGDMLWHLNRFGEAYWPELEQKRRDLINLCRHLDVRL